MKSEGIEQKIDEYNMDEEILNRMEDIPFNRQAMCFFMSILEKRIEPYYNKMKFEPGAATFVLRKFAFDPVYCELEAEIGNERKVIVKAYDDRNMLLCDNNPNLARVCGELSNKTHGNIMVYPENNLKYLY